MKNLLRILESRRCLHTPPQMKCFQILQYAQSVQDLEINQKIKQPQLSDIGPDQAIVKVEAASVNPFDLEMSKGYGVNAMNIFRNASKSAELPLILGRDCTGTIIARGKRFRRYQIGDSVWCVRWIVGQGTHAQYVVVNKNEVGLKPKNLSYVEASALPYVACTAWNALINTGAVNKGSKIQKIFIPGGTGGIGSFAVQLCQSFGHEVVTSCGPDGKELLINIGARNILDYTCTSFEKDLKNAGPFDVILDTLNEKFIKLFQENLRNQYSKYVSLRPSLLPDMDEKGVLIGLAKSSQNFIKSNISQISSKKGVYIWGFFSPNALILDEVKMLVEKGLIKPVVDRTFTIDEAIEAYKYLADGHARGKTILTM